MDFRARYQNELEHLRLAGQSFSKLHSQARHLAERGGDPDVERLLEGFAFLCAKVQARIDAGTPELIGQLAELLAPAQLRPIPSCTMLEFTSDPSQGRELVELGLHTQVCSEKVQDLRVRFRSTQPLTILPMVIERIEVQGNDERSCKVVVTLQGTPDIAKLLAQVGHLDLFMHGGCEQASNLYHSLLSSCAKLEFLSKSSSVDLGPPQFQELGFEPTTPLLPWPDQALLGQRTLAEYFSFPQKFRQLRIQGLTKLEGFPRDAKLDVVFHLQKGARELGALANDSIKIHCAPAINLFDCDAEPITQDCIAAPRRIRIAGHRVDQFELYDCKTVTRALFGQEERTRLPALFSSFAPPKGAAYFIERRPGQLDEHSDAFLRILDPQKNLEAKRTLVSMELLCSHRKLASELSLGQISRFEQAVAPQLRVRDLYAPTQSSPAPLHGELQWQLFSWLAATRSADLSKAQLQGLLWSYNHQARLRSAQGQANQQLSESIRDLRSTSFTGLAQGLPTRGRSKQIEIEEQVLSPGQAYLFGRVLHELFSDMAGLNTLHRTELQLHPSKRRMIWNADAGSSPHRQGGP